MSKVWDKIYNSGGTFFGEEPSNFALLCFNHMKTNDVHRILELGAGQGRDSIFSAAAASANTEVIKELADIIRVRKR